MAKQTALSNGEWIIMEHLWEKPHTLWELVAALKDTVGWSKSTIITMLHRMEDKGAVSYTEQGRTKYFYPLVSRDLIATDETKNLLQRAFHGRLGLLVNAMAQSDNLTMSDIEELYDVLKKAEEKIK